MKLTYCVDSTWINDEKVDMIIDLFADNLYEEFGKYDNSGSTYLDEKFKNQDIKEYTFKSWGEKTDSYKEGIVETDLPYEVLHYLDGYHYCYFQKFTIEDVNKLLGMIKDFNEDEMETFVSFLSDGLDWQDASRAIANERDGIGYWEEENVPNVYELGKRMFEYDFSGIKEEFGSLITDEVIEALKRYGIDFYQLYGVSLERQGWQSFGLNKYIFVY